MIYRHTFSAAFIAAMLLAVTVVGCSRAPSGPKEADLASDAEARSSIITTQIALDTEGPDFGNLNLTRDILVNGIVTGSAYFASWHATGQNLNLSKISSKRVSDEETKVAAVLRRLPRLQSATDRKHHVAALTPDEAAHVIIVGELLDAGYASPADLPGVVDANHAVIAGAALDGWFTAHAGQPLVNGSKVTLATEASRVVAEIDKPQP